MIIGLVGTSGAGKSTAVKYLKKKGFYPIELSVYLSKEAKKRKIKNLNKRILQDIGNELREKFGASILAKLAIEEIRKRKKKKAVLSGIRNPKEIIFLKAKNNFHLLGIDAKPIIRFQRIVKLKGREWVGDYQDFLKIERRDSGGGKTGLQVRKCLKKVQDIILNNDSLDSFFREIDNLIKKIPTNKG